MELSYDHVLKCGQLCDLAVTEILIFMNLVQPVMFAW
jgi:hypothetical protein